MGSKANTQRILVVDDDTTIFDVLEVMCSSIKYHVSTATSADECMRKLEDEAYDVILVDIWLQHESGLDLIEKIRSRTNSAIIAMSVDYDQDKIAESIRRGCFFYMVKPFTQRTLHTAIMVARARSAEMRKIADAAKQNRDIGIAIGYLMAKENCSEKDAYEMIRKEARSRNTKIINMARKILANGLALA